MATTGNRPYSSRPRQRSQPTGDFDAPTPAERKRMDKEQSAPYRESYDEGRKQGREESRKKSGSGRRRPVPGARSARTAARQLQAPVRAQVTSGLRIVGMTLALVALYNILVGPGPDAFSGVMGGLQRALHWLSAPIPVPERH